MVSSTNRTDGSLIIFELVGIENSIPGKVYFTLDMEVCVVNFVK